MDEPRTSPLDTLDPPLRRLIEHIETSLHLVVRENMTREAAIEVRQRVGRALGHLARKHGLVSELALKRETRAAKDYLTREASRV